MRHVARTVDAQNWLDPVTAAVRTGTYVDRYADPFDDDDPDEAADRLDALRARSCGPEPARRLQPTPPRRRVRRSGWVSCEWRRGESNP